MNGIIILCSIAIIVLGIGATISCYYARRSKGKKRMWIMGLLGITDFVMGSIYFIYGLFA